MVQPTAVESDRVVMLLGNRHAFSLSRLETETQDTSATETARMCAISWGCGDEPTRQLNYELIASDGREAAQPRHRILSNVRALAFGGIVVLVLQGPSALGSRSCSSETVFGDIVESIRLTSGITTGLSTRIG